MPQRVFVFFITIVCGLACSLGFASENAWHKLALDKIHVVSMAADPVRPSTLYAVTSTGLLKSTDSGGKWEPIGKTLPSDVPASCVAVNPHNSKELYVGYDGKGLFKSQDGGATWKDCNQGLPNLFVRCIVISPKDPNLVYIGVQGGVAITTSAGKSWHQAFGFKKASNINAIALDPNNPQYMYAATGGAGVYKSGNGGVSWKDINDGLSSLSILDIYVDPENPDILLAGAYHPATPTDLYVGEANGGVFRSIDGGRTWKETPLINLTVFSFAKSKDYPGTIYVGAWGGAYRSMDKGETWIDINAGLDNAFLHKMFVREGKPPTLLGGTTFGLLTYTDTEIDRLTPGKKMPEYTWYALGAAVLCILLVVWFVYTRRQKNVSPDQGDVW